MLMGAPLRGGALLCGRRGATGALTTCCALPPVAPTPVQQGVGRYPATANGTTIVASVTTGPMITMDSPQRVRFRFTRARCSSTVEATMVAPVVPKGAQSTREAEMARA